MAGDPHTRYPNRSEIEDELVEWISQGLTLRDFARLPGKPSFHTLYVWEGENPEFASRIARARDIGFEQLAQQCLEIADDENRDVSGDEDTPNGVAVQRDRLRIDTRLKLLAKWNPKKYGDKLDLNHGGEVKVKQVIDDL